MFQHAPKVECLCSESASNAINYPSMSQLDRLNLLSVKYNNSILARQDRSCLPFIRLKKINSALLAIKKVLANSEIQAMPRTLVITNTQTCNLSCPFCASHGIEESKKYYNDSSKNMGLDFLERIAKEAFPYAEDIWFSLIGEPLHIGLKTLNRYIEYVKRYNNKITLNTNGTLLTPSKIELLTPYLKEARFSLDGASRQIFEKIRRGSNFYKTMRNVKLITRVSNLLPESLRPEYEIKLTLCGSNIREMPRIVELANYLDIKKIYCNFVILMPNWDHIGGELVTNHKRLYNMFLEKAKRKAEEYNIRFTYSPAFDEHSISSEEIDPLQRDDMIINDLPADYYSKLPSIQEDLRFDGLEEEALSIAIKILESLLNDGQIVDESLVTESLELEQTSVEYLRKVIKQNGDELMSLSRTPNAEVNDCWFLDNYMDIRYDGDARICCDGPNLKSMMNNGFFDNMNSGGNESLGNVKDSSVSDVFNGPYYNFFKSQFLSGNPEQTCINCIGNQKRPISFLVAQLRSTLRSIVLNAG